MAIAGLVLGALGFVLSLVLFYWRIQGAEARRMAALAAHLRPQLFVARDLFCDRLLDRPDLQRTWWPTQRRLEELVVNIKDAELRELVDRLLKASQQLGQDAPGSVKDASSDEAQEYRAGYEECERNAKLAEGRLYALEVQAAAAKS